MNTGTNVSVIKRVYTIINKFICQVTMTKIKNLEMASAILRCANRPTAIFWQSTYCVSRISVMTQWAR